MANNPTPEQLAELADWFDNPNESPCVHIDLSDLPLPTGTLRTLSAGYVLRRLSEAFDEAQQRESPDG